MLARGNIYAERNCKGKEKRKGERRRGKRERARGKAKKKEGVESLRDVRPESLIGC